MNESKASRTLLKSPPELWSEVSDATSLQRHMDQFGEIRITKLEPETAVAWEGEHARGTITLEGSGWGTRVSLTAEPVGTGGADEPLSQAADQPQDAGAVQPPRSDGQREDLGAVHQPRSEGQPQNVDPVQRARSGVADADAVRARAEPADVLVGAESVSARVEPRQDETPDPQRQSEAEVPAPTIALERDRAQASMQKPRWTQRLAGAFMRWFSAAPREDAHPVMQPAPDPPTTFLAAPAPERDQTA